MALNILDIVELRSQGIIHVDDDDLPVGLALIEQSHDTKDLDLNDFARLSNELANLADVQWIIVTLGLGLLVDDIGVFPSLQKQSACQPHPISGSRHRTWGKAP